MNAQLKDARRLLAKLILVATPIMLLITVVNYYGDPGELFYKRTLQYRIVDWILDGKNVRTVDVPAGWAELELRIVRGFTARRRTPQIVVWGTSRSSELSQPDFPGRDFFNHVLPGGTILDYVALYDAYVQHGTMPATVIISLDPWSFCARSGRVIGERRNGVPDPAQPLKPAPAVELEFERGMRELGLTPDPTTARSWSERIEPILELFSPSYFQSALHVVDKIQPRPTTLRGELGALVVRSDGSYTLAPDPTRLRADISIAQAKWYAADATQGLLGENLLVQANVQILERLIDALRARGVRVILFLPPIHPVLYDLVTQTRPNAVEPALIALAKKHGAELVGSFNPHRYGYKPSEPWFIDEYHPSRAAMDVLLKVHEATLQAK